MNDIREMFPDYKEIEPGNWSAHNKSIGDIEIGLYREPLDTDEELAGTLTLQIFDKDDVVVCKTVNVDEEDVYEFYYQVECDGVEDGGEFFGGNAQECADYIRKEYTGYKTLEITSILRVETEW